MPRSEFTDLPDPAHADSVDSLIERLRLLKVWAGNPSYEAIKDRVNTAWAAAGRPAREMTHKPTVANCFRPGRRWLNTDLVLAVVESLHPDVGYVTQWRQALRAVAGEIEAISQVRVQDSLPLDQAGFTGRTGEMAQLRRAAQACGTVVISAIEGMAGVGKTQFAVHAGHLLLRERAADRVLFVNLRGFHPDPAQPPADPAAVLDGFLRLVGVPGHHIPHDLPGRTAAYRRRLAGTRTLVVLDNAASAEQVAPLLPMTPGCVTLVTSRRSLADLDPAVRLTVDVFTLPEAVAFVTGALPGVPVGPDPAAAARIARRCGCLPLALGLVAGHIRNTPGWTLTDHADRLDERHDARRLDDAVELALDLSYQHLPDTLRRLLRLLALHPGLEFDVDAAAALAGTDVPTARTGLDQLRADHLVQPSTPGRFTLHDLVRVYATTRAHDKDAPAVRRAALTRLFDHYMARAADKRTTPAWLDTERSNLIAVAVHAATNGWPAHTTRLARTLNRYLRGGYHTEALTLHGHALVAARHTGDRTAQAHALMSVGVAHLRQARAEAAADHLHRALSLFRQLGDRSGEARARTNLGFMDEQSGRLARAGAQYRQALTLARLTGHRRAEVFALYGLGRVDLRSGRFEPAAEHLGQALELCRQLGHRIGEASVLDSIGSLNVQLGRVALAADCHRRSVTIAREIGDQDAEAWMLNSLGDAARSAGDAVEALAHHGAARAIADQIGSPLQGARAHAGLGQVHHSLGNLAEARAHYRDALTRYAGLGLAEAAQIERRLAELELRTSRRPALSASA
ncbi:tetratricopeptide repeat protein [Actinoplanes sp. Pm04-4]|uniref:Tetratricopeptide repeat protein n=1 Tax=Paractinoplanes pyxinae TaxID=2997416 RepID=A0ABT4BHV6_9ACTN|nr:tetratricopeptide repeat protein [Actinoplanes pyxinae]MCY1145420.1 tetratricopeptide repeat protein [Actinoplanes pyxinae]